MEVDEEETPMSDIGGRAHLSPIKSTIKMVSDPKTPTESTGTHHYNLREAKSEIVNIKMVTRSASRKKRKRKDITTLVAMKKSSAAGAINIANFGSFGDVACLSIEPRRGKQRRLN